MELDAFEIFCVQNFPLTTWKVEEVEYQTVPSYKLRAKCRHGCSLTVSDMSQERNQVNTLPNRIEARHRNEIVLDARQI